jgi:two-component system, NtrC family, sensor histidine kinase KinB
MTLSLRQRIVLTLLPLMALLAILGGTAMVLLQRLGGRIDLILRENYRSVLYMERLNEALERIDSSFQFAIADREDKARAQYRENWSLYLEQLHNEEENVTEPGEDKLVEELDQLTKRYRRQGEDFYSRPAGDAARHQDYFGPDGLEDTFKAIKNTANRILRLNQQSMEQASADARQTARNSVIGFGVGLAAAVILAGVLAWHTIRSLLRPIRLLTESALNIGAGNLDQVVPVATRDELGSLADAFNSMARQLRHYRQTDYARLLRAQRTSQATIDSFPHPVLVVNEEGRVFMANAAAQHLFGFPAGSGDEQAAFLWQPPEGLGPHLDETLRQQRPYLPSEFDKAIAFRTPGGMRSFLPRLMPISDPYGNTLGAAVLLEDVTRFRLLDQVKSDLVATASHELKTPLTSLRLVVHLLLEEAVGPLTPKQTELLLDARDSTERLLGMVNNLLDLAQLERRDGALDLRPEEPTNLLKTAADTIRPRAEDKDVSLTVDVPSDLPLVAVDGPRLGRALDNLLDNALAYSNRGGQITLAATAVDGAVTLSVADTGSGIPPEHLPHLFERFHRIPGHSRRGSTGLGLAIVHEIVTAHGGTISVESTPGVGTTFRIRLPVWQGDGVKVSSAAGVPEVAP